MTSRRTIPFFFAALVLVLLATSAVQAQTQKSLWQDLVDGNQTYVDGHLVYENLVHDREASAPKQDPPYTILSCADSRVPPELIFNKSLDRLFVVRVAGNVADTFGLASIEYAIAHDYTKMIVVMGHEDCGAVKTAVEPGQPNSRSLRALVARIRASFQGRRVDVKTGVELNACASAANLVSSSSIVRNAVRAHKVEIVVAYYNMVSGRVDRLECPRPRH